jgi:hypothetical protein
LAAVVVPGVEVVPEAVVSVGVVAVADAVGVVVVLVVDAVAEYR